MGWKYLLGKKKKKKPNLDVKEWTGCWVSQDGHSNWGGCQQVKVGIVVWLGSKLDQTRWRGF